MTLQDLRSLLEYHYWARDRMLVALEALTPEQYTRDLGSSFRSIRDTAVHVYAAEWVWYSRWQGESPATLIKPETFVDVATLKRASRLAVELNHHLFDTLYHAVAFEHDGRLVTAEPCEEPIARAFGVGHGLERGESLGGNDEQSPTRISSFISGCCSNRFNSCRSHPIRRVYAGRMAAGHRPVVSSQRV